MTAPGAREAPRPNDLPDRAPFPERVRLHPDVYALLARWIIEDLARTAPPPVKAGEP